MKMKPAKRVLSFVFALVLLATPVIVWAQRQSIWDWYQLRNYTAPASISALATADNMTSQARHIFYVNHPQLVSNTAAFRQLCSESEQTIVLGCYHPLQNGIAVYDVQDARLNGVEEVTAAHEMLHAAYDRLNSGEKEYINGLLADYYRNGLQDKRIQKTIEAYKITEPNDIINEMHSIFGTEISTLPSPLENYYKRYFTDRSAVTTLAANYQGEFSGRIAQIEADDQKLADMKKQIESEESNLKAQLNSINAERAKLSSLRSSRQIDEYNAGVLSFNAEVNSYNLGIVKLQKDIAAYNDLVESRNQVAGELKSLDSALDTRLTTQPVQ